MGTLNIYITHKLKENKWDVNFNEFNNKEQSYVAQRFRSMELFKYLK